MEDHVLVRLLYLLRKKWRIRMLTDSPHCLYYFGPFDSKAEATQARSGYIEDLEQEGAHLYRVAIARRSTPTQLTVEYAQSTDNPINDANF